MKNIFKSFAALAVLSVLLFSCKKDDNQVVFEGGTNPVLSSTNTGNTIALSFANSANTAITFNWTNPDYMFTTGISSQDVTYTLEIDTAGANFSNPKRQQVTVANNLSFTLTQGQLND